MGGEVEQAPVLANAYLIPLSASAVTIAVGLLVLAWIIYAQRLVGRARARGLVPAVASGR